MRDFKLSLIQMRVEADKAANLKRAESEVVQAADRGADLVVLPEMFSCPYDVANFRRYAELLPSGETAQRLARVALRCGVFLAGGSVPEVTADGQLYNTALLFGPDGALLLSHRKLHLFDIDIPDGIRFQESAVLDAGNRVSVVSTALGVIGLAVCFDLRFPEQFRAMALAGAELMLLPGAFNTTTGPAHWEPLLRVRAIENTAYVAACSPAPHPAGGYPAWGHSMVVGPFGDVMAEAGRDETVVDAPVSATTLRSVRAGLRVLEQRRPDAYGKVGSGLDEGHDD